jgi:hypothetical protein
MRVDTMSSISALILLAMMRVMFVAVFIGISGWISLAQAQHVIVPKNGRQITVQSYREEGSMIKFVGLGRAITLMTRFRHPLFSWTVNLTKAG